MGIFRTLYRELRDIAGLKPPPENETQLAERVCGELKGDLGGKREKQGDNYLLSSTYDGREVKILCEAESGRAIVAMMTGIEAEIAFAVTTTPEERAQVQVASGIFTEGAQQRAAEQQAELWKALPTGARGVASQILKSFGGRIFFEDGALNFIPEKATLQDKSARYTIKMQLQSLVKICVGMEEGWGG
ncbi:MAG: hypothetical protein KC635_24755 [Myxococcales bacterium]|nr:hypothetical protein [Myxococcales bacterium]MCB9732634.1 hypothetical protein [Deltaproteobacteria bacterium]